MVIAENQNIEQFACSLYACSNDYKGKPLGWMSENMIDSFEPNEQLARIKNIQDIQGHRVTSSRTSWLCNWTGATEIWELQDELQENYLTCDERAEIECKIEKCKKHFDAMCRFLSKVWCDKHFRPFDTIQRAEHYILTRKDSYLVRLSSTHPGAITISFTDNNNIRHKRFRINLRSQIIDANGKFYDDISKLASSYVITSQYRRCIEYVCL